MIETEIAMSFRQMQDRGACPGVAGTEVLAVNRFLAESVGTLAPPSKPSATPSPAGASARPHDGTAVSRFRKLGFNGFAARGLASSLTGPCAMATADNREPPN